MAIKIDLGFLSAVLQEKAFSLALEKGITSEHIEGERESAAWRFIESFYKIHRDVPSIDLVQDKIEFQLPIVTESINFWIGELCNRKLYNSMNELHLRVQEQMNKDDPNSAYLELVNFVKEQEQKIANQNPNVSIVDIKEMVIEDYRGAKLGKLGIPTPWKTVNDWTGGWYEEDVSYLVGGSGVGKTWGAIFVTDAALTGGYEEPREGKIKPAPTDTLLISCEQNIRDIGKRFFSYKLKKPYQGVHRGELNQLDEGDFLIGVEKYYPEAKFEIKDASSGVHIFDIERAIEKSKAKLIVVDAFYKIIPKKDRGNRFENVADVANDLKVMAQKYKKAIVATSQINRDAKKKKEGMGQEDIAFSDTLNNNGTNVIGIQRTDENKKGYQASIYPIKVREGDNQGKPLIVNWNFVTMDFLEPRDTFNERDQRPRDFDW